MNVKEIIKDKTATVAVVGLGNVGLNCLTKAAFSYSHLIGIDIDKERVENLNKQQSYLSYLSNDDLALFKEVVFSDDYSLLKKANIVCFCLPTASKNQQSNTEIFEQAFLKALEFIQEDTLLIIESTLPLLFSEKFIIPSLKNKFQIGHNIFYSYCPERINPGNPHEYPKANARVFAGSCPLSSELTQNFYHNLKESLVELNDLRTCEFTKIFENAYRALNISFVDEMKTLADKLNINIYNVIHGAKSKGMSFEAHYPSSGIGGACIPMALDYLVAVAKETNTSLVLTPSAIERNKLTIKNISDEILKYKKVLILGASYKKNIADLSESATLKVLDFLANKNIALTLCDPYFTKKAFEKYDVHFENDLSKLELNDFDAVVLMTDHTDFNLQKRKNQAKKWIDPKGILQSF